MLGHSFVSCNALYDTPYQGLRFRSSRGSYQYIAEKALVIALMIRPQFIVRAIVYFGTFHVFVVYIFRCRLPRLRRW